ncbi:Glucokinase [Pirellulimonas nuda]|uniref:Glucokinase n=1 Tax=Pirellulimonas nuda TaxID=2528009 RepID=A0A518DIC7_9BACT|nr:ROK family protein [Pirellulimonas nuda]QDU91238.1 Glucokinase [Pirellulimonas nuda]
MAPSASQSDLPLFIGVDVGGTGIKIGLVTNRGITLGYKSIATEQERGVEDAAGRIAHVIETLLTEAGVDRGDVRRLGLATPGPMDVPNGILLTPGNIPAWRHTPIRKIVSEACKLPVTYANDANAAAYGEFWSGAGRRFGTMVMVTLGTGVGGGVILDDVLVAGAHSCGGEVGHIIIDCAPDAPLNSLGIRGTLEGYCGSYGVVRRTQELLAKPAPPSTLRDRVAAGEELTPLLVAQNAEEGDELSLSVVMETARLLAIGIVTLVHTLDPEGVVIGGAMTFGGAGHPLGERFLAAVRAEARGRMIEHLREAVTIEFAKLAGDAGFIGAAGLARRDALAAE